MLGASLEQASHHVVARAIVQAGAERALRLKVPGRCGNPWARGCTA